MRAAAREAITDALERGWTPGRRVGLLHAVVISEVEEWRDFYLKDAAQRRVRDYLTLMPSTPVSMLMQEYDFHGPAMNVSAMCSSGNAGLITAKMWLDADIVDDVVFVVDGPVADPGERRALRPPRRRRRRHRTAGRVPTVPGGQPRVPRRARRPSGSCSPSAATRSLRRRCSAAR